MFAGVLPISCMRRTLGTRPGCFAAGGRLGLLHTKAQLALLLRIPAQVVFGEGGGIAADNGATVRLDRVTFKSNKATKGADMAVGPGVQLDLLPGTNIGLGNNTLAWTRTR